MWPGGPMRSLPEMRVWFAVRFTPVVMQWYDWTVFVEVSHVGNPGIRHPAGRRWRLGGQLDAGRAPDRDRDLPRQGSPAADGTGRRGSHFATVRLRSRDAVDGSRHHRR